MTGSPADRPGSERIGASLRPLAVTTILAAGLGACGTGVATNPNDSITVISHGTTRDISVWTPEGDGPWPVVYVLHGLGGHHTTWANWPPI